MTGKVDKILKESVMANKVVVLFGNIKPNAKPIAVTSREMLKMNWIIVQTIIPFFDRPKIVQRWIFLLSWFATAIFF